MIKKAVWKTKSIAAVMRLSLLVDVFIGLVLYWERVIVCVFRVLLLLLLSSVTSPVYNRIISFYSVVLYLL